MEYSTDQYPDLLVESTNVEHEEELRLADDSEAIIFQMFIKNIYSNPIGSIVREITSNCFDSHIEAWTYGPVVPALYHEYKQHDGSLIPASTDFDLSVLTDNEFELVKEVFDVFGQYSAWKLRDMTHEESPWQNHADGVDVIPVSEIAEYFKTRIK
jgi:uncharacterized phage-associated protein